MATFPVRRVPVDDGNRSTGFAWHEIPIAGDGVIGVSRHNKQPVILISVIEPSKERRGQRDHRRRNGDRHLPPARRADQDARR